MTELLRSRWMWLAAAGITLVVVIGGVLAMSGGGKTEEVGASGDVERGPGIPIVVPADEAIVIGVSTALTGPSGHRGSEYRDAALASLQVWKEENGDEILGHKIQVVAEDDGCTEAEQTGVAAESLLRRVGLVGVIGPQCSSGVAAVQTRYRDAAMVTISGAATATGLTQDQPEEGYFFRTAFHNDLQGTLIGQSADLLGAGPAVIVDNNELYGRDLARAAVAALRAADTTVTRKSVEQGAVDFTDVVADILAEEPTFVGFAGFNPEAALLYRQLRDAGYEGTFGAGDGAASQEDFVDPIGPDAEGVLFAACRYPLPDDFAERLRGIDGRDPSATFAAHFADATTVLLDAVATVAVEREDGSLEIEPEELRDAVRATDLEGLTGRIAFDSSGDRVPEPGQELEDLQEQALAGFNPDLFVSVGMVPCQVQGGRLVNVFGPESEELRVE